MCAERSPVAYSDVGKKGTVKANTFVDAETGVVEVKSDPSPVVDEFDRSSVKKVMKIQLRPHERKGWWKSVKPEQWTYRAKALAKINDTGAKVLFDTGAEVSLISSSFAHKLGVKIDSSQAEVCEGIGGSQYQTDGSCVVKLTLANELVYELTLLAGPMEGQDLILGLDFMTRAAVRVDAADGSVCLPGDVYVRFEGRRQLFSSHARPIYPDSVRILDVGASVDVKAGRHNDQVLWIRRDPTWVTSIVHSQAGIPVIVRVTNVSDKRIRLSTLDLVGVWMSRGSVPKKPGFVMDGSRRSAEWKNLAYSATQDQDEEDLPMESVDTTPMVERREYPTPKSILRRDPNQIRVLGRQRKVQDEGEAGSGLSTKSRLSKQSNPTSVNSDLQRSNQDLDPEAAKVASRIDSVVDRDGLTLKDVDLGVRSVDPSLAGVSSTPDGRLCALGTDSVVKGVYSAGSGCTRKENTTNPSQSISSATSETRIPPYVEDSAVGAAILTVSDPRNDLFGLGSPPQSDESAFWWS